MAAPVLPLFTGESRVQVQHTRAAGGVGSAVNAGRLRYLDLNQDTHGQSWYGSPTTIGVAQRMERDAFVRMSLKAKKAPLLGADWAFEAASEDPLDQEIARLCDRVILRSIRWNKVLKQILNYPRDGFSLFEATTGPIKIDPQRFPNHPGNGTAVGYTAWHHIPAWSVWEWHQSKTHPSELEAITQWIQGSDAEQPRNQRIDGQWLIRFTEDQDGAQFDGLPTLRSAYGHWLRLNLYYELQAMRHERQEVGIARGTLPENVEANDENTAQIRQMLAELRSHEKGYVLQANGLTVDWLTSSSTDGTAIAASIEAEQRGILHNVAAGWLKLGDAGSPGSHALAQTQDGHYALRAEEDAHFVEDVVTDGSDGWSPTRRIVALNYGEEAAEMRCPRLRARNLPVLDKVQIAKVVNEGLKTGLFTADDALEDHFRRDFSMPARDPETARRPPIPGLDATEAAAGAQDTDDAAAEGAVEEEITE